MWLLRSTVSADRSILGDTPELQAEFMRQKLEHDNTWGGPVTKMQFPEALRDEVEADLRVEDMRRLLTSPLLHPDVRRRFIRELDDLGLSARPWGAQ